MRALLALLLASTPLAALAGTAPPITVPEPGTISLALVAFGAARLLSKRRK